MNPGTARNGRTTLRDNPPVTPPTARNTTLALHAARQAVPDLRVVVKPDLRGRAWLVDRCCDTIYMSGQLTLHQYGEALIAALAVLVGSAPRTALVPLIPAPRAFVAETAGWAQSG